MTAFHRTKAWRDFRNVQRALIEKRLPAPCVDCGRAVLRTQKWHVGHIIAVSLAPHLGLVPANVGPSHARCNLRDGGRMGAAKTNRARSRAKRGEFPSW
ncbi:recombination protein NinG [Microbacterium sp. Ag1]|uniref:recombination protein NinG n=1 Tax=Microbacterium sp. Ag1 TaxID=1643443 RepID=UPI0009E659E0